MEKNRVGTAKLDLLLSGYPSLDQIVRVNSSLKEGRTALIENGDFIKESYGGCNVNIAYNLQTLGLNTGLLMNVGRDFSESGFKGFLTEAGINLDGVKEFEDALTSRSFLITEPGGEQITLFYPGAASQPGKVPFDLIKQSPYIVITVGNWEHNQCIMKTARQLGVPVVLGMKGDFVAFPPEELKNFISGAQILVMNQAEKHALLPIMGCNDIDDLFCGQVEIIIETRGKEGSIIREKIDSKQSVYGIPVCLSDKPLDPSGVGDAFLAGFLFGYLKGQGLLRSGKIGSVMASFTIEARGCLNNVPKLGELSQRYCNYFQEEMLKEE